MRPHGSTPTPNSEASPCISTLQVPLEFAIKKDGERNDQAHCFSPSGSRVCHLLQAACGSHCTVGDYELRQPDGTPLDTLKLITEVPATDSEGNLLIYTLALKPVQPDIVPSLTREEYDRYISMRYISIRSKLHSVPEQTSAMKKQFKLSSAEGNRWDFDAEIPTVDSSISWQ